MGLLDFFQKGEKKPASEGGQQGQQPQNQPQSQPQSQPSQGNFDTYTVKSGDSLSKIAKNYYGDAMRWKEIYEANKDQISNPDLIQPGWVLKVPRH